MPGYLTEFFSIFESQLDCVLKIQNLRQRQKMIDQFQIDPVQFGVIMVLCSMIGLLTPPVGMSLYAVATISNVSIGRLTRELFPYLLGILIVTLMITYIPMVSLWLPGILMPE